MNVFFEVSEFIGSKEFNKDGIDSVKVAKVGLHLFFFLFFLIFILFLIYFLFLETRVKS